MAVDFHKLIAAISPDIYCKKEKEENGEKVPIRSNVKKIAKEEGYLKAAEKAELVDYSFIDFNIANEKGPVKKEGLKSPLERHTITYETTIDSIEPLYFWAVDKMGEEFKSVEKLVDNFVSSPGSNYFAEMTNKAKGMQEEGMKMLGAANQVLKSILNLIYDLKEFEIRLEPYDLLKSKDSGTRDGAMFTLKQLWMDTVDIKRGNSSIKALALSQQGGFITLIDAFMAAESVNLEFKGKEIDLNDRVKRILQQRVSEFYVWIEKSEQELRKRFEIEKNYLKSQYSTVQLYTKWAKPYLRAAKALEQTMSPNAAITSVFNAALFELTLFGKKAYDPSEDIAKGDIPQFFKRTKARKYNGVAIFEVKFRSLPERTPQGINFRVKAEITVTGYGLNDDELAAFKQEIEKDDMNDTFRLIEGSTTESLGQIKNDIDHFLGDKKKKEEEKKKEKSEEDINPFTALADGIRSLFNFDKKEEKKEEKKKGEITSIQPDNEVEKVYRSQAIIDGRKRAYKVYDGFKKSRRMASLPGYA